jgi:hypothetical protein
MGRKRVVYRTLPPRHVRHETFFNAIAGKYGRKRDGAFHRLSMIHRLSAAPERERKPKSAPSPLQIQLILPNRPKPDAPKAPEPLAQAAPRPDRKAEPLQHARPEGGARNREPAQKQVDRQEKVIERERVTERKVVIVREVERIIREVRELRTQAMMMPPKGIDASGSTGQVPTRDAAGPTGRRSDLSRAPDAKPESVQRMDRKRDERDVAIRKTGPAAQNQRASAQDMRLPQLPGSALPQVHPEAARIPEAANEMAAAVRWTNWPLRVNKRSGWKFHHAIVQPRHDNVQSHRKDGPFRRKGPKAAREGDRSAKRQAKTPGPERVPGQRPPAITLINRKRWQADERAGQLRLVPAWKRNQPPEARLAAPDANRHPRPQAPAMQPNGQTGSKIQSDQSAVQEAIQRKQGQTAAIPSRTVLASKPWLARLPALQLRQLPAFVTRNTKPVSRSEDTAPTDLHKPGYKIGRLFRETEEGRRTIAARATLMRGETMLQHLVRLYLPMSPESAKPPQVASPTATGGLAPAAGTGPLAAPESAGRMQDATHPAALTGNRQDGNRSANMHEAQTKPEHAGHAPDKAAPDALFSSAAAQRQVSRDAPAVRKTVTPNAQTGAVRAHPDQSVSEADPDHGTATGADMSSGSNAIRPLAGPAVSAGRNTMLRRNAEPIRNSFTGIQPNRTGFRLLSWNVPDRPLVLTGPGASGSPSILAQRFASPLVLRRIGQETNTFVSMKTGMPGRPGAFRAKDAGDATAFRQGTDAANVTGTPSVRGVLGKQVADTMKSADTRFARGLAGRQRGNAATATVRPGATVGAGGTQGAGIAKSASFPPTGEAIGRKFADPAKSADLTWSRDASHMADTNVAKRNFTLTKDLRTGFPLTKGLPASLRRVSAPLQFRRQRVNPILRQDVSAQPESMRQAGTDSIVPSVAGSGRTPGRMTDRRTPGTAIVPTKLEHLAVPGTAPAEPMQSGAWPAITWTPSAPSLTGPDDDRQQLSTQRRDVRTPGLVQVARRARHLPVPAMVAQRKVALVADRANKLASPQRFRTQAQKNPAMPTGGPGKTTAIHRRASGWLDRVSLAHPSVDKEASGPNVMPDAGMIFAAPHAPMREMVHSVSHVPMREMAASAPSRPLFAEYAATPMELRKTPVPQPVPQPQEMSAPPVQKIDMEQLQQAIGKLQPFNPDQLAEQVYKALSKRLKFEQRLRGY